VLLNFSTPLYSTDIKSSNVGIYSYFFSPLLFSRFTFIQALQPSEHDRSTVLLLFWSNIGILVVVEVEVGFSVVEVVVIVVVVVVVVVVQGWPLHTFLFLEQKLKINL
jgi:hypothetical protein